MVNGERRLAAAGVIDAKARRGAATRGPALTSSGPVPAQVPGARTARR
jgi:hypothetical protein